MAPLGLGRSSLGSRAKFLIEGPRRVVDRLDVSSIVYALVTERIALDERHRTGVGKVGTQGFHARRIAIAADEKRNLWIMQRLHQVRPETTIDTERTLAAVEAGADASGR